jgi:quercetin dioxygenase-like cupin family protein
VAVPRHGDTPDKINNSCQTRADRLNAKLKQLCSTWVLDSCLSQVMGWHRGGLTGRFVHTNPPVSTFLLPAGSRSSSRLPYADYCCSREAGYSETGFGSQAFTVTPLVRHAASVVVLRLGPSGRIGRHRASGHQVFAVVEGEGIVSGGDFIEHRIRACESAVWQPGEQHETRTEGGMTAVVSEGPDILLELPLSTSVDLTR